MTPIRKIIYHASRTEFTRYFWAGSLTFLVDFTILLLLTEFAGIDYLWSNLAGVCVGIVVSYLLCIKWVFVDRLYNQVVFEFPLFALTCVVGILINEFFLWVFVEFGGIHYLVSKVIVTAMVFAVNFFIKKILLFRSS
jgi:putative flippase GtrA